MKVSIKKSTLNGEIYSQPSKSYSHRLLIASMLSNSYNYISNIHLSNDIKATINAIEAMGYKCEIKDNDVKISYLNKHVKNPTINCDESGSTLRFLIPIALCKFHKATFIGTKRLLDRGVSLYEEMFKQFNITFKRKSDTELLIKGYLLPGEFTLRGDESSQYITGLLFTLPMLNGDSTINILPPVYSKNYIEMTLDVIHAFNIKFKLDGYKITVYGNQDYIARNVVVEGDYSNAAFLDAFNHLNSSVHIKGLNKDSLQGDKVYKQYFEALEIGSPILDISNCIDLGPVLFALAALKKGATFIGTKRLQIKESDRANAMASELKKFGVDIKVFEDKVIINKSNLHTPDSNLSSHNDHRIAMALSLFASQYDIVIEDAEAINKSYPNYFNDLKMLGADVNEIK